jgi:hypothetical protein
MARMPDLLTKAADALDDGIDPLHFGFLSEHDVTSDECLDMAAFLALGARLMAWAIQNPKRAATLARGGLDAMHLEMITETLRRMNKAAATAQSRGES